VAANNFLKDELKEFNSIHADGMYGFGNIQLRSQESLDRWNIAEDGTILGMWQRPAPTYKLKYIDMHRALLGYRPGGRPETVILNGVDLDEFRPRRGERLEGEPAAIVSAAVHRLHKRPQEAVRLVNRLAGDYPRIRLHVLGAFDPLVEEALVTLDTSRCTFHGRVHPDKLAAFYAGADVQLALCVFDACPNAVSEGLASGLPVLTPAESGAAELIGSANRGWAIREGIALETYRSDYVAAAIPRIPIDRYADAFRAIMDDPGEASRRARARAEAALDIREIAARYTAFIDAALAGRDSCAPRAGVAPP